MVFVGGGSTLVALGRLAGLIAGYSILVQFFLMGRNPLLERVFGLDKLARYHQWSGRGAFFFLLAHPILIMAGYAELLGNSFFSHLGQSLRFPLILLAAIGLLLFVAAITAAIFTVRRRLKYEVWYLTHLLVYLAAGLAMWHQFSGTDPATSKTFYFYWLALYIVVFGSHIIFRFSRPFWLFWRHGFYVSRVERESPSVVSIYISGKKMDRFRVRPGQFMFFRFLAGSLKWQSHPFSLSVVPDGKEIRISVKAVGDFTTQLHEQARVGMKVFIDGPYGIFTEKVLAREKVLLIAGGIGITPLRSLCEQLLMQNKEVVLLYGNRVEEEIVFRRELETLATQDNFKLVHILSDQVDSEVVLPVGSATSPVERGYIDAEKIRRLVPDFAEREIFLCGPPVMMNGLIKLFRSWRVQAQQIHFEKFSL